MLAGLVLLLLRPAVAWSAAKEAGDAAVPYLESATRSEGNHVFAYSVFFVLAGMALTIVFRGIRAR